MKYELTKQPYIQLYVGHLLLMLVSLFLFRSFVSNVCTLCVIWMRLNYCLCFFFSFLLILWLWSPPICNGNIVTAESKWNYSFTWIQRIESNVREISRVIDGVYFTIFVFLSNVWMKCYGNLWIEFFSE